jgi:hypothetical protein
MRPEFANAACLSIKIPQADIYLADYRHVLILILLFATGLGIRLYGVNEPPLEFHSTRQYRSLIIARGYYFDGSSSIPEWKRQVAAASKQKQGILEPPLMEFLVSRGYRLFGEEHFWLPRLLSSLLWLIGGGFLYLIGRKIADPNVALFATAFYLFVPFGVVASRSFQPDPLMVTLLLASTAAILCYHDAPSKSGFTIAAIVSSLSVLVKPHAAFVILTAFTALAVYRLGIRQALRSQTLLLFMAIVLVPTVTIYIYNLVSGRFFIHEADKTLLPRLLMSGFFWQSWVENIRVTVGFIPFVGALFGSLFFRERLARALMIGLWSGYALFGLVLNYNFATHDYYQLQLIPIVGLSVSSIIGVVLSRLKQTNPQFHWHLVILGILALAMVLSIAVTRARLVTPDVERQVRAKQEIGELVNHSTKTIFLSSDYGVPLEYHGLLSGASWPLASDLQWERLTGTPVRSAEERFNTRFAKDAPAYFIVEDFRELEQQPDLKRLLAKFPMLSRTKYYAVFKLQ